ncbi:MAG: hypothetical protein NW214_14560 [Pseudanabaenaceae cyanobacterium bins.39]|nr:hypothetical protein [Pseudanabaenaceae cyanobacterium bins.39]
MNYSRIVAGSILLSGLLPFTDSVAAQETPALWSHCKRVIAENVQRLEATPKVKVTANSGFRQLPIPYPDRKANLNREYRFALDGDGVVNVWQSTKLMTEITEEITNGCVGTAAVSFGRDYSSDFATVGLFPDGSIKKFTCGTGFSRRSGARTPQVWGEQACF